jgi:hypothetical protein
MALTHAGLRNIIAPLPTSSTQPHPEGNLMPKTAKAFETPCQMPNGLQWTDEGLFIMDQLTDNVYVVDERGKLLRTIHTLTENGSGITVGGGYIWTASNGRTVSRPYRSTDTHLGYIYKLDLKTGEAVDRYRTPDGGGLHGLEWDNGLLWVTQFNPKALVLVDPKRDFKVVHKFEVDLPRAHGLARDGAGIWCAFTGVRTIVKYNVETGREMERALHQGRSALVLRRGLPEEHGHFARLAGDWDDYGNGVFEEKRPLARQRKEMTRWDDSGQWYSRDPGRSGSLLLGRQELHFPALSNRRAAHA